MVIQTSENDKVVAKWSPEKRWHQMNCNLLAYKVHLHVLIRQKGRKRELESDMGENEVSKREEGTGTCEEAMEGGTER